jgi:hypothetical protein
MSSIKARNVLLVVFVVLTIIFGSLSAFEFVQVQKLKSQSITTSTTANTETLFTTSTITITATVPNVPDEGLIGFGYGPYEGVFAYKRVSDFGAGASVTFRNVTFYSMPLNTSITGCEVYYVRVTFPDGISERADVGSCVSLYPSIAFTTHSSPKAGVIFSPGEYQSGNEILSHPISKGIYLLVSGGS